MIPPTFPTAPTLIAIEASSQRCSVALAHAGAIHSRDAEGIAAAVRELLDEQSLSLDAIDAFAFAAGPGGFTGLRVACACVQGLAYGCGRPALPINSLRALAHAVSAPAGSRLLAAVDARMGQVYWGVFEADSRGPQVLAPAALADPDELAALVARWQPDVIAGDALSAYASAWPDLAAVRREAGLRADARAVAALARLDWDAGGAIDARDAAPEYVRDRVALTVEERRVAAGRPREAAP